MNQNKKADLHGIGFKSKTDFTGGETKAFSTSDYTAGIEAIQSIIPRVLQQLKPKTVQRFDWKRQKPGRIKAL